MKLILQIEAEHDLLGPSHLTLALPGILDVIRRATSAGIVETGPNGIDVAVPGTDFLARARFRLRFQETVERLPAAPLAADSESS